MENPIAIPGDHAAFLTPASELAARSEKLRQVLGREGIDLALITHVADLVYFTGSAQSGVLAAPADAEPIWFVSKSFDRARAESPLADIRPSLKPEAMIREAAEKCGRRPARVGMNLDTLTASTYLRYLKVLTESAVVDASPLIRRIRMIKSEWEIALIEKAAEQVRPVLSGMERIFRPGMSEVEISAGIEQRLRVAGHPGMVRVHRPGHEFAMLVVSGGPSAAYPVHLDGPIGFTGVFPSTSPGAGRRVVRQNETFMADIVSCHNGYLADHARTYAFGRAGDETRRAHDFCRDVLREIVSRLRPGEICGRIFDDIAGLARKRGEPEGFMGFGGNRVRFFGHGVGLELDELPVIAHGFETPIEEGMVIAVEPKAFSPVHGPAGLENTYLITKAGSKSLGPDGEDIIDL